MPTIERQTPGVHEAGGLVPDHLSRLQEDIVLAPAVVPDLQRPGRVDLGKSDIKQVDIDKDDVRLLPSGCGHLLGDIEDGGDDVCLQVVQVGNQPGPAAVPE